MNSLQRIESKYFPVSIETLIEEDLQKLQEANQEVVEDDGNGEWGEDASDAEEEGDAGIEGPPGSEYGSVYEGEVDEYPNDFENEDLDAITLGIRIYTKGGAAVSVTGNVVGEMIIEKDEDEDGDEGEDKDEDKGKGKGKGEDKGEDKGEEDKDKKSKKKAKKQKGDKHHDDAMVL